MIDKFSEWIHKNQFEDWKKPVGENSELNFPGEYEFLASYEENDFKKNIKNPDVKYYIDNPLKYKFNSQGFRMDEDFKDNISVNIFLGCSDTFGFGLHQSHTWSYKLHKHISKGEHYWNLALPGNGIQTDFRTLYYILNKYGKNIKINNIFHLAQYRMRLEFFDNIGPNILCIHDYDGNESEDSFKHKLLYDTNNITTYISNINAIENLAKKYNSNYYVTSIDFIIDNNIDVGTNRNILYDESLSNLLARDLGHPSYDTSHQLFSVFLDMYNTNSSGYCVINNNLI
jgi:hypothetical protein